MKTFYLNLLMLFLYCMTHAQSNTHHPRFVTPNYQVYSSYRDGNTLYLGGAFNGVGYNTGALAGLSPQSDIPDFDLPFLNGTIYCVIPDNSGGWYVGGSFNYSDGVITRYNILKILANKTADLNFNCNVNSTVRALALGTNNLLYIGGSFSEINATSRSYLAAANKNTGALNAWNPVLNSSVLTLQLKDSLLVSGGQFTVVNNTIRNYLAVFNINTGALLKNYPGTNYHVNETYIHNNTVYAGGLFSYAGKYTGSAVKMQGTGANPDYDFPAVNGTVYTCIPDGSGGWYIGGSFSQVGTRSISNLAHIKSDKSADTLFLPNPNSTVRSLALKGNNLYVGGSFTTLSGQPRQYAGAINKNTGFITSWAPELNSSVYALFVKDSLVYLGGAFTLVNGLYKPYSVCVGTSGTGKVKPYFGQANYHVNRFFNDNNLLYNGGLFSETGHSNRYLAKLSTTSDLPEYDFPTTNGTIYTILPDGSGGFYIGGSFSQVNAINASNLAHIKADKSVDGAFIAECNSTVRSLALVGNNLYVGGNFSTINGLTRQNLGAVNKNTGAVINNFIVNCNGGVYTLLPKNNVLYIGGAFSTIDSVAREYAAAVDLSTNQLNAWDPDPNYHVNSLLSNSAGTKIYLGGLFSSLKNATARNYIGCVNTTNGTPTAWNPGLNSYCYSLLLNGANIIAGGSFTLASGAGRNYLAEFDTVNGNETAWNPGMNGDVYALAKIGSTIYAGGNFTLTGATTRRYIAAINSGGTATSWDPRGNGAVNVIVPDGTTILIGGGFTFLKAFSRNYAYCANLLNNGVATNYDPAPNSYVYAFAKKGSTIYLGGSFSTVKATGRTYIAATDSANGNVQAFNPGLNGDVYALYVKGTTLFAGGLFTTIGGVTARGYAASFNTGTGALTSWSPNANADIRDISYSGNSLMLAGQLTWTGGGNRSYVMSFDLGTDKVSNWSPVVNSYVFAVARRGNTVYLGGSFSTVGGAGRNALAAVNASTAAVQAWNPGLTAGGTVYDLALKNDTIYAGGTFSHSVSNYLVSIKSSGGIINTWKPEMNSYVNALCFQNGILAAGGSFSYTKYAARNYFCAIDMTTGLLTDFAPALNSYVRSILVKGSTLYLGGDFSTANNVGRLYLAAFNKNTGALQNWNPTANNSVYDLATDGNLIYAAGGFSSMNASPRNGLAALSASGSGAVQAWDPAANAGAFFRSIFISGSKVFVGGTCSQIGAAARTNLALVDTDAVVLNWTPNPNGIVYDLNGDATNLYVAGSFSNISGNSRSMLASYTLSNNAFRSWAPVISGSGVWSVSPIGSYVYFGGSFSTVQGANRTHLAAVNNSNSANLQPWNPVLNSTVYTVHADTAEVFAGGAFTDTDLNVRQNYFRGYDASAVLPREIPQEAGIISDMPAVKISQALQAIPLQLSPNPAQQQLTLTFEGNGNEALLQFYSLQGALMRSELLPAAASGSLEKRSIDISELPEGMYLVRFSQGAVSEQARLLISR